MALDPEAVRQRALDLLASTEGAGADMAERRARRLAGQEPEMWKSPQAQPEVQANALPPQVQPARPDWNTWADTRIARALHAFSGQVADGVGEVLAVTRREMRAEIETHMAEHATAQAQLLTRLLELEAQHAGRPVSRLRSIAGGGRERAA